jgi:hypothetical protein
MEMVPGNKAHVFKKGDLVKWWYSSPIIPHAINKENERSWTDIGIVLSVENWEGDTESRSVIEVYFARGGPSWCNPKSLGLISRY